MKQAEIWETYFDSVEDKEQAGRRPAVIISGDTMNNNLNIVIICPFTSKIHNYKGNPIVNPSSKNGLKDPSEILVFQTRAMAKGRLRKKIGTLEKKTLDEIHQTLNKILKL
jgi:mRNA interferase MazF